MPLRPIRPGGALGERCGVGVRSTPGAAHYVTAARCPEPPVNPLDAVAAWRCVLPAQAGRRATPPPPGQCHFPRLAAAPSQSPMHSTLGNSPRPRSRSPAAAIPMRRFLRVRLRDARGSGRPRTPNGRPSGRGYPCSRSGGTRGCDPPHLGGRRRTRVVKRRTGYRIRAHHELVLRDSLKMSSMAFRKSSCARVAPAKRFCHVSRRSGHP